MEPPRTADELIERARAIAGRPLSWIAARHDRPVPPDLRRHKGWIGELIEAELGATAGSRAQRDFPDLGIELKTLPVDPRGRPHESTYVCTAHLEASSLEPWPDAWVRRKLMRVLWLPIVGSGPPGQRVVGAAVPWSPSDEEEAVLRADYELLAGIIARGEWWDLTAHHGQALQIRPKAASSSQMVWALDEDGEWVQINPRGYYLRPSFTGELLRRRLLVR